MLSKALSTGSSEPFKTLRLPVRHSIGGAGWVMVTMVKPELPPWRTPTTQGSVFVLG